MLRQSSRHASDPLVRRPREELSLPVSFVPQPRDGKGEERQGAPLVPHRLHHLLDEPVLFEVEAPPLRRLDQGPPQGFLGGRPERREVHEHGAQALVLAATEEKVVAEGEQDVQVGLGQSPEQVGEPPLNVGRVQGEQLLELVHDEERLLASSAPACDRGEKTARLVASAQLLDPSKQLLDRLGVTRELRGERAGEGEGRARARRGNDRGPALRSVRNHGGSQKRRLADPGGADHGEEPLPPDLLPQRGGLDLATEEELRVGFGERVKARVGARLQLPGRRSGARLPLRGVARLLAEGVAKPVGRPEEAGLSRVVVEGPADAVDGLVERGFGDEHAGPDDVADLGPGERPGAPLDEQDQQLVGLGLQGDRPPRPKKLSALLVELEIPKRQRHRHQATRFSDGPEDCTMVGTDTS